MMRLAMDASVLLVIEGFVRAPSEALHIERGRTLLRRIVADAMRPIIPIESLAALHAMLVADARLSSEDAAGRVLSWARSSELAPVDRAAFDFALDLTVEHGLSMRNALACAATVLAGCVIVLSLDLPDRLAIRGLTVSNPFGPEPDRRIASLLMS